MECANIRYFTNLVILELNNSLGILRFIHLSEDYTCMFQGTIFSSVSICKQIHER